MSADSRDKILDKFSIQTYDILSVLRDLTQTWPSEIDFIRNQVNTYVHHVGLMATQLEDLGSFTSISHPRETENFDLLCTNNFPQVPQPGLDTGTAVYDGDARYLYNPRTNGTVFGGGTPMWTDLNSKISRLPAPSSDSRSDPEFDFENYIAYPTPSLSGGGRYGSSPPEEMDCQPQANALVVQTAGREHTSIDRHAFPDTRSGSKSLSRRSTRAINGSKIQTQSMDEETTITETFMVNVPRDCTRSVPFLRAFCQAAAGTDAMLQLRDIIKFVRSPRNLTCEIGKPHFSETVSTLDRLESMQYCVMFVRRVLLLRMRRFRKDWLDQSRHQTHQRTHADRRARGRLESIVLDQLTHEAYPDTVDSVPEVNVKPWRVRNMKVRKAIKNRLSAGRNWEQAVETMGLGILALVPTGGEHAIRNHDFETLRDKSCKVLLEQLYKVGFIRKAAAQLTPLVQAVYDAKEYPGRLRIESVSELGAGETYSAAKVLEWCAEDIEDRSHSNNPTPF